MKKVLKKLMFCVILIITVNIVLTSIIPSNNTVVYAGVGEKIEDLLGTVVGLLTWPIRLVAIAVAYGVQTLMGTVAFIENSGGVQKLSPYDILFNTTNNETIALLNINFFKTGSSSILTEFKKSIATWYYAFRTISSAILLVVLIYVGIRMALSNVAEQKASYKKMLADWAVSLVLIFMLQYIILFTIYVNDALVDIIRSAGESIVDADNVNKSFDALAELSTKALGGVSSIAATVVYLMIVAQTFGLFISYFNRMLKLAFLVIISPLITLTYSIDKIGDGKAQALNTWLKEYVYSVLIQPFHCIIYMAFVNIALDLLGKNAASGENAVAASIIAILCIKFIKEAEKIVGQIFNFKEQTSSISAATGMAVAAASFSKAQSIGKGARKAVNAAGNLIPNASAGLQNAKVEALALGRIMSGNNKDENGNTMSADDLRADVRSELNEKKAEKEMNKKYGVSKDPNSKEAKEFAKQVETRTEQLKAADPTLSDKEAKSLAKVQVAKENRQNKKKAAFSKKHPNISGAVGAIRATKELAGSSQVLAQLGKVKDFYVRSGVALAAGGLIGGATGDIAQGVMAYTTTSKISKEFQNNRPAKLQNESAKRLKSLGAMDAQTAGIKLNAIMANSDKYTGTDELDKLKKEIEEALKKAGAKNKKNDIMSQISKGIKDNPSANLDSLVNNVLKSNGVNATQEVKSATKNFAEFSQEKAIFDEAQQAAENGVAPDKYFQGVTKRFNSTGSAGGYTTNREFITSSQEPTDDGEVHAPSTEEAEEFIDDKNEKDIEQFYKDAQREVDKLKAEIANYKLLESQDPSADYSKEIEKLKAKMEQTLATKAKIMETDFDRNVRRLESEYRTLLEEAKNATTKDAQTKVTAELQKLQQDYNKYIAEADNVIREVQNNSEVIGLKSEVELNIQKSELEAKKLAIDSTIKLVNGNP